MTTCNLELLSRFEDILNVITALSSEKDHYQLLKILVEGAKNITRANAALLYLRNDNRLILKIVHNNTVKNLNNEKDALVEQHIIPMAANNVCSYAVLKNKIINIPNVYQEQELDFSELKKIDELISCCTSSMLVVPLENHTGEIIGVLQLINACNEKGESISFNKLCEKIISFLASQTAIAFTNSKLILDIERILNSFVEVMATAIDSRAPYNANHTRRVALLAGELAHAINESNNGVWANEFFGEERITQLVMAGWLHDVGKIAIPISVMNKSTRLAERIELILQRLDYILLSRKAKYLEKKLTLYTKGEKNELQQLEEEWSRQKVQVEAVRKFIINVNNPATFVDKNIIEKLTKIASLTYTDPSGQEYPWLSDSELTALSVIKGTLTKKERRIMEDHVIITQQMLNKIPFTGKLKQVPFFAGIHHEHLNGNGYPRGLKGDDIPLEGRILALVDVFDALTALDRPYKKEIPLEQALKTLESMVQDGELDGNLFDIFCRSKIWERVKN